MFSPHNRTTERVRARQAARKRPGCLVLAAALATALIAGVQPAAGAEEYWIYTVRPGDNLWKLSQEHLWHFRYYRRLQELNGVDRPKRLLPGTHLRIPVRWMRHEPAPATLAAVSGDVRIVTTDGKSVREANAGEPVHMGESLVSGDDGNALLRFADGSTMALRSGSELIMDTLRVYGRSGMVDTRLRLQRGRTDTRAAPARGPASRYQITTPASVTAVRGTRFRVAARSDRPETLNEVLTGTVMVSGRHGAIALEAGSGLVTRLGEPGSGSTSGAGDQRALLLPPELAQVPERIESFPARIRWNARDLAQGYRVQVGDDADLIHLYVDRVVDDTSAVIDELPDGWHTLVVRSIGAGGLEGPDALARIQVDAPPPPPAIEAPADDAWTADPLPAISWRDTRRARQYRLQMSRDARFAGPGQDIEIPRGGSWRLPEPLDGGTWWWRIASIDRFGQRGPWGPARRLNVLDRPELLSAGPATEPLQFAWHYDGDRSRLTWDFQLARDPAFQDRLRSFRTGTSGADVYQVPSGEYYARVRAVGADGTAGHWSEPRRLRVTAGGWWKGAPVLLLPLFL